MKHLIEPEDFSLEEIESLVDLGLEMYASPQKYAHVCQGKNLSFTVFRT